MKLSCLQENLAKALNIVGRAVAPRTATLPVLTHILLASDNGRLRVSATNLELGVNCWIGAKVEDEGAITLPARTLTELVSLLPSDRIDLELNNKTQAVRVHCSKTDTNIKGIDAQEFPIVPIFDPEGAIYVNADVLRKLIAKTVFAAATDESRPMLTGVLIRMNEDRITLFASDGFRLSVCSGQLAQPIPEPRQVLVPAKTLAEVGRIVGDQQVPVAIAITPARGQILFHLENVDVVSQLIDQKFPEVEALIPKKYETLTVLNTADLLKACKQASIFARDASDVVRVRITPSEAGEGSTVDIAARADEKGDNMNELEASCTGVPIEIGFNVKFLIDVLSVIETPQVSLSTVTPKSPGLFKGLGDESFQHIVMPINLPKS